MMGRNFQGVQSLLDQGAQAVKIDLRDEAGVVYACMDCEVVIHAAALSSPWGKPEDFHAINIAGTQTVLNGCKVYGVRRLIHISTPAVIFDGRDQIDAPDTAPYAKRHLSHYSFSKQKAEERVLAETSLETIILRPKAIYGPGDKALLPRLLNIAKSGRLPRIGNGQNRVALTYVSDVVAAVVCALHAQIRSDFPVYTITGPENPVLWEVIQTLLDRLHIRTRLRPISEEVALKLANILEAWGYITGREPRLTRYTVALLARHQTYDISRARRDLGYVPKISLDDGLNETIKGLTL